MLAAEPLGPQLSGGAVRAYELGLALAPYADVVLAGPEPSRRADLALPVISYHRADPRPLLPELARCSAVVAQPPWPHVAAALRRSQAELIFDLYDPEPFEVLEFMRHRPRRVRDLVVTLTIDRIAAALRTGDHFLCASEKQRDLWLGAMLGERLVSADVYDRDPSFDSFFSVVPFGIPEARPVEAGGAGPRELPGVGADSEIVLWNGGIWSWLDAPTAIRAIARLANRRPRVRLIFMGASSQGPAKTATAEARALAEELGLAGDTVHFHDQWVPYAQRADWLLDANCAISTHRDHLETRFAFRTRILDCLWAGLPVVCTRGDDLASRVQRDELGMTVPAGDPEAVAAALERVLDRGRGHYAGALARARQDFTWRRVAQPLVRRMTDPALTTSVLPRHGGRARPGQIMRDVGFRAVLGAMAAVSVRRWPTLR